MELTPLSERTRLSGAYFTFDSAVNGRAFEWVRDMKVAILSSFFFGPSFLNVYNTYRRRTHAAAPLGTGTATFSAGLALLALGRPPPGIGHWNGPSLWQTHLPLRSARRPWPWSNAPAHV